jgi:hypothetical protein
MQGLKRPGSRESRTQEVRAISRAGIGLREIETIEMPYHGGPIVLRWRRCPRAHNLRSSSRYYTGERLQERKERSLGLRSLRQP